MTWVDHGVFCTLLSLFVLSGLCLCCFLITVAFSHLAHLKLYSSSTGILCGTYQIKIQRFFSQMWCLTFWARKAQLCTAGLSYLLVCVESCMSRPEWSLSPQSQPPGLVPLICLQPCTKISHIILLFHLKPFIFLLDAVDEKAVTDLR